MSLRDALAYHGAQMTVAEAEAVPLHRLSTYVHAAVHAIQRRCACSHVRACVCVVGMIAVSTLWRSLQ